MATPISPESLPSPLDFFDFDAISSESSVADGVPTQPSPIMSSNSSNQPGTPSFSSPNPFPPFVPMGNDNFGLQWLDAQIAKQQSNDDFNNASLTQILSSFDPTALEGSSRYPVQSRQDWFNHMPSPPESLHGGSLNPGAAIDPHLFGSVFGSPHFGSMEDQDSEDEDDEDEDMSREDSRPPTGKKQVAAGGVTKRGSAAPRTKEQKDKNQMTLEEYKKLDPKAKRQERNKRSAQKFRERRKQYITELEHEISKKGADLAAARDEAARYKKENSELRDELASLREAVLEGRNVRTTTPSSPAQAVARRSSTPLAKVNPYKDIAPGSSFWGGASMNGGFTSVHTTLLPDLTPHSLSATLSGKASPMGSFNINPLLNSPPPIPSTLRSLEGDQTPFDNFSDSTNFSLKTLDDYRMHLWTRLAKEAGAVSVKKDQEKGEVHPAFSNLAAALRPAYFYAQAREDATRSKINPKALLTPPPSPYAGPADSAAATATAMYAASLASHTLVSKLSSAFWDAFSGAPSSSTSSLDAKKVQAVLEGKAVVRVVDVESADSADSLAEQMQSLSLRERERSSGEDKMCKKLLAQSSRCAHEWHSCAQKMKGASGVFQHVQSVWREAPAVRR